MGAVKYFVKSIDFKDIDSIRPLWEELNASHAALSMHFGKRFNAMTFKKRKVEFGGKAEKGAVRVDGCMEKSGRAMVGYCVSNVVDGVGEVDSLFIKKEHRGKGAGALLMKAAMAWMRSLSVKEITVHVAVGNEAVLGFYRRSGLVPRLLLLSDKRGRLRD